MDHSKQQSKKPVSEIPEKMLLKSETVVQESAPLSQYQKNYTVKGNRLVLITLAALFVVAGFASTWLFIHRSTLKTQKTDLGASLSPVPATVMAAVDYKVYYPDIKKLPAGYNLDEKSFNVPVKNGITYTVSYGNNKKIVFSLQTKPSDNELASFRSNYIPLRTDFQTPIGPAQIGAYNAQTLVSLPVLDGPWIVITAPPDIDQDQLKQVISSLKT